MNTTTFKNLIRESIREELAVQLPIVLKEFLTPHTKTPTQSAKKPTVTTKVYMEEMSTVKPTVKRTYTSNTVLNDILNETVVKIPNETSVSVQSVTDTSVVTNNPTLSTIFNKDYSAVLKAADEKAKRSRG
jgi:hypothetical protein